MDKELSFLCTLFCLIGIVTALDGPPRSYGSNSLDVAPGGVASAWSRDPNALPPAHNTPQLLMTGNTESLLYRPPINQHITDYRPMAIEQHFLPKPDIQPLTTDQHQNRPNTYNPAQFMPLTSPEHHFIPRPLQQQSNHPHVGARLPVLGQPLVLGPPPGETGPRPYLHPGPDLVRPHSLYTAPHLDTPGITIVTNNVFIGRPHYPQMMDKPGYRGNSFGQRVEQDNLNMPRSQKGRPLGLLMMKLLTMAAARPDQTVEFQSRPTTDIDQLPTIHHHHMDPRPVMAVNQPRTEETNYQQPGMMNTDTTQARPFSPLLSQQDIFVQ